MIAGMGGRHSSRWPLEASSAKSLKPTGPIGMVQSDVGRIGAGFFCDVIDVFPDTRFG